MARVCRFKVRYDNVTSSPRELRLKYTPCLQLVGAEHCVPNLPMHSYDV